MDRMWHTRVCRHLQAKRAWLEVRHGGHDDAVVAVRVIGRRFLLSASKDASGRVGDMHTAACIHMLEGHQLEVTCMDVAHAGDASEGSGVAGSTGTGVCGTVCLVTGSADKTARCWYLDAMLSSDGCVPGCAWQ